MDGEHAENLPVGEAATGAGETCSSDLRARSGHDGGTASRGRTEAVVAAESP